MIKPPYTKWINDIKAKLGFNRTMTASGEDVVDAINKQSRQINGLAETVSSQSQQIANLNTTADSLESGLAVVANGDTHAAITKGQYVYIKNHASLAEGLYTANDNIDTNGALSNSNLAIATGGLNILQSDIRKIRDAVDKKITYTTTFDVSMVSSQPTHFYCDRVGKIVFVDVVMRLSSQVANNTVIGHVNGLANIIDTHTSAVGSNGTGARFRLTGNGYLKCESVIPANEWFSFTFNAQYNNNVI